MTLEDKLRAAFRETAGAIPGDPPSLDLSRSRANRDYENRGYQNRDHPSRVHSRRRWAAWAAPLAAAAVVVAVIAGSLAVTGHMPHPRASTPAADYSGVPPYYVALTVKGNSPDSYASDATAAEVRATATGAVLARIAVPKPYAVFAGVTAAADDRAFVLVAEEKNNPPEPGQGPEQYYPHSRFFLLQIAPGAPAGSRVSLRALPDGFIPADNEVKDLALSPDGTSLAADVGYIGSRELLVFNLATGTRRAWSFTTCRQCGPSSGGLGFGGTNVDELSWTADGRHLAFIGPATVSGPGPVGPGGASITPPSIRLLDVSAPGSNLLANSKIVLKWPGGVSRRHLGPYWRGMVITPDGRTVVFLEQLETFKPNGGIKSVRWRLAKASVATGKVTAVLPYLKPAGQYEQVMYTNATGHDLVVYYFGLGYGTHVGILHGSTFTPIKWNPHIMTAAW
jgi:hypothetical protein